MKKMLKISSFLLIVLLSTSHSYSQSTSWKGTTSINWSLAANWTNGLPDITKDVILGDGNFTGAFQPKVNAAMSCKSLTIGGAIATNLTIAKGLTISGGLFINANGNVSHGGATINLSGDFMNSGIYSTTATSSRIIFKGTSQAIGGTSLTSFRSVTINVGSTITLQNNIEVTGASSTITINGIIEPGQSPSYSLSSTGITKLYGNLKVYGPSFSSNYVLTGTTTLYSGSIVEYASTTNQVVSSAYSYSTLIISGSGTKSLLANLPLLYGKNVIQGRILVNAGTFDIGTFTANRATTVAGGEINVANGAVLKVGGTNNFPTNFLTKTFGLTSTVEYNGTDQTVSAQTYGNLLFSTAGIKTAVNAFSVMGDLTISNGTINTNATAVTHAVAGNFTMTGGAFSGTNYTYSMIGTADQTMDLISGIDRLDINNTGGNIILTSDLTVNTTLNFTKGNIRTNSNKVIIPTTGNVTGALQSTGWVNGNLQKNIAAGTAIFKTFEVGQTNYSPANILFASVSNAGTLMASTIEVDQPEIDYSGLDPAKSVNRYWILTNSGIIFTNATASFDWTAVDIDAGSSTTNFKAGLFNGASWSILSTSSSLPTSIQVTGITSLGDFSVGEIIGKSTWTGNALTADWFTPKNWLGLIPSTTNPTFIPNGIASGRFYPILTGGTGTVNDITIESGAYLTINSGKLQVAGQLTSSDNVDAIDGTVEFNGSASQTLLASSFVNNTIKDLIANSNLTLADVIKLKGTLSIGNGKTLSTSDLLVLRSDATGTARISSLPVDGSGNATAFINGKVSIERYIPARKAWRLLSAPIQASAYTIDDAWQEGAYAPNSLLSNPNPNPGYGVHIAGGTLANGFDQSPTNTSTIKVFNNATNGFVALPAAPGTFAPITNYPGYMIYIRGDRSIDLSQGNNAAITSTTLRMKGDVKTGKQTVTVNATNSTILGNPFPSAIDFATLTRNNVKNSFYVWDPKLAGSNGLGAYVAVSWNSGTNSYDITTSASPVSQYIPSGEAILVESMDGTNPGSIEIKESDKTTNGSDFMYGRQAATGQQLRVNLYEQKEEGSSSLLDGVLTTYNEAHSNNLDKDDMNKLDAGGESISIKTNGRLLAIERRKSIEENEIIHLNIAGMKPGSYKFAVTASELEKQGYLAVLKDTYSNEINNTPLNTNGTTEILFSINENEASFAADRFSIVFIKAAADQFTFRSVHATPQQKNIAIEFETQNESLIKNYSIETSADGSSFSNASSLSGKRNQVGISSYSWFDLNVSKGIHYYRIKAVSMSNEIKYSNIIQSNIAEIAATDGQMVIYPNPVKNNTVSFQINNLESGMYVLQISNMNGQTIKRISISHNAGDLRYSLLLDGNIPTGKYQLQLTGGKLNFVTPFIKE